jgi:uncharacterized protein involved in exopolysaccharide biosynthesis
MGFIESERTINLIDYFRILTRHKWTCIFSLVVAVGVCIWYNSKLIPIYGTSAVVVIDRESTRSPITGQRTEYESYLSESMTFNTHFEMITSQAVLERVVRNLNLDKPDKKPEEMNLSRPNPLREWFSRIKKNILSLIGNERELLVNQKLSEPENRLLSITRMIKGMVTVEPIKDTRLLIINTTSPSPVMARDVANGLAQAYIDFNLDTRMKSTQNTLKWLTNHLYEMKKKLEDAEEEFLTYKQSSSLVSLEDSQKTIAQKTSDYNNAYIQARNRRLEVDAKLQQLSRVLKSGKNILYIPRLRSLIDNDLINNLYSQLVNAEGERSRLLKVYKSKHPKVTQINTKIANLRKKLNQEMRKDLDNLKTEQALLLKKENLIQKTIADLKDEAMEINKTELKYTILKRNVEMNQGLYDTILSRLKETDITSNIDVSNIRILEKAFLPGSPMGPNKKRNIILAIVLGLIIGIGFSFLLENIDRTVHTEEEIKKYVDLPVLSIIPVAQKAKKESYYGTKE